MKPELQRIAIAEACGTKVIPCTCTANPWQDAETRRHLPNYLNDLNAMHEAEKLIRVDPLEWQRFVDYLNRTLSIDDAIHATAAERAEAFLRTLDLWTDDN